MIKHCLNHEGRENNNAESVRLEYTVNLSHV